MVRDRVIEMASDRLCMMTGYSRDELLGRSARVLYPTREEYERVGRVKYDQIREYGVGSVETRLKHKNGTIIDVYLSSVAVDHSDLSRGVVFTALDITERRRLEELLRQSQKMEAVGRLAGGLAHDFNNLLTGILGYSQLALDELEEDHPARGFIETIRKTGRNASDLTDRLLAFSRRKVIGPKVICLNETISSMQKMLNHLIGEDVSLSTVLEPRLFHIKADPNEIAHIIVNLAINARDAMPSGGQLIIATQNVVVTETSGPRLVGLGPGEYALMAVSDTGVGMSDEVKSKIFEPFFTTKDNPKGTGLGLSIVYGIVAQSGGHIWIRSGVGVGTTVKIYLPRADEPLDAEQVSAQRPASLEGTETVLVVEDQQVVRSLARRILAARGYEVLEARTGLDALEVCRIHGGPIHLMLTDVIMPEMSGMELAAKAALVRPEMEVVFMSGYAESSIVDRGLFDETKTFIQKPFDPETLATKVREVLEGMKGE